MFATAARRAQRLPFADACRKNREWVVEVSLSTVSKNSPTACGIGRSPRSRRRYSYGKLPLGVTLFLLSISLISQGAATGPTSNDCLACHSDKSLTAKRGGRAGLLFVEQKKFTGSIHGSLPCTHLQPRLAAKGGCRLRPRVRRWRQ